MNVLSLFDGIACGRIALERAGVPIDRYIASEIDKNALLVSSFNYPDIIHVGDVSKVREYAQFGLLGNIDVLIGGSPCQGFSKAGKNLGFDDPRSQLMFEFIQIKDILKPKYFLLENVVMSKSDCNLVSALLNVDPITINSVYFSAQNRIRNYWTNIPVNPYFDKNINLKDVLFDDTFDLDEFMLNKTPSRMAMWKDGKGTGGNYGCVNLSERNKSSTVTTKMDRFSNAGLIRYKNFCRYITPVETERLQTIPDNYTACLKSKYKRWAVLGNAWTVDVLAHIFEGIKQ